MLPTSILGLRPVGLQALASQGSKTRCDVLQGRTASAFQEQLLEITLI